MRVNSTSFARHFDQTVRNFSSEFITAACRIGEFCTQKKMFFVSLAQIHPMTKRAETTIMNDNEAMYAEAVVGCLMRSIQDIRRRYAMTKTRIFICAAVAGLVAGAGLLAHAMVGTSPKTIQGDYVEVRSCDVYTGSCFANSEMNLTGRDAMLCWSIRQGTLDGVKLDGLKVMAVVQANNTLGDVSLTPEPAHSVLIVDESASPQQRDALIHFAQNKAGALIGETTNIASAPITVSTHMQCTKGGCIAVHAGDLAYIQTRCLSCKDCVCGNEELFYPPLTKIDDARPAYTICAAFHGRGLNSQFDEASRRSAYLGSFGQ
jgi:hypothetical protein